MSLHACSSSWHCLAHSVLCSAEENFNLGEICRVTYKCAEAAQLALDGYHAAGGEGEIKYAWVSRDRGVTASERNMS